LQVRFAERAAAIQDLPLAEALFAYTSLPIRCGAPFTDLVVSHPRWQTFLALLRAGEELEGTAVRYHRLCMSNAPPMRPQYGCFSFDYLPEECLVRLHFANNDDPEPGVLSAARRSVRLQEL